MIELEVSQVESDGEPFRLETLPRPSREQLQDVRSRSLDIIISNQYSSGFFPAADKNRFSPEHHYHHVWPRDNSIVVAYALHAASLYDRHDRKDKQEIEKIYQSSRDNAKAFLNLYDGRNFRNAFRQEVEEINGIKNGKQYTMTRIVEDPPAIHLNPDGSVCSWPRQNQPDSFGGLHIAYDMGIQHGLLNPTEVRHKARRMTEYLCGLEIENFIFSTIWEGVEVMPPSSISTPVTVRNGLESALRLYEGKDPELCLRIKRAIHGIDEYEASMYPTDWTTPQGHESKTDLATLVSKMSHPNKSWDERTPFSKFQIASRPLRDEKIPGMKRFIGDDFTAEKEEEKQRDSQGNVIQKPTYWFMELPYMSIAYLRKSFEAKTGTARAFYRNKGFQQLSTAVAIGEKYGYYPEMLIGGENGLKPNRNDLLWNRALMVDAAGWGIKALDAERNDSRQDPTVIYMNGNGHSAYKNGTTNGHLHNGNTPKEAVLK